MPRLFKPYPIYRLLLTFAIILSSIAGSSQAAPRMQQATAGLPPALVSTDPINGTNWAGGPVTFTFDQPLAAESASSLKVDPTLAGTPSVEGAKLIFTPDAALEAGTRYHFTLDTKAKSAAGVALSAPVALTLVAATPLQVTSTQPSDGAKDINTDGQIVVVFNRPVVPLTGVDDQAQLPQPLTIEPAVDGKGQWLNTSVYLFQPTLGLAGGTAYQVTVDQLTGLNGETLAAPVTFSFTTATPVVTEVKPTINPLQPDKDNPIRPDAAFHVTFSQPMDPASTEAAFSIKDVASSEVVAGNLVWESANKTFTFTPTQSLAFGASYVVTVEASAQPASRQGNLRERYERTFDVFPLPTVSTTTPPQDAAAVSPEQDVIIRFSAPVSATTVLSNVRISPMLSTTQVYSYYSPYNGELTLSWNKKAQTAYTVTVGSAVADEYGNTLGQDYNLHFATGDFTPYSRINLDRFTHFNVYSQTLVSLYYRNIPKVEATLYRVPMDEFFKLTGQDQYQIWNNYQVPDPETNRVWTHSYAPNVERNITGRQVISLTDEAGNQLTPGIYLLEVAQLPKPKDDNSPTDPESQKLIILGNQNLVLKKSQQGESLAWVTDLRTGQPVPDQKIRFYRNNGDPLEATSGPDGIATTQLELDANTVYQPVIAMVGEPGDANFAAVSSEWNQGVAVYDFNLNTGYGTGQYQLYFYTDRPIYKPGQTIYWKGIVRSLTDDQYTLPPPTLPISITVRDAQGVAIMAAEMNPSENGTLNGKVTLAPEAGTGYYYLDAQIKTGIDTSVSNGVGFLVNAYRKPEFQIEVTSAKPEYVQGDKAKFTVKASYFSGGPLANAPVDWQLLATPYQFNWTKGPSNRYFSFDPYDPSQDNTGPYRSSFIGMFKDGQGTTDAAGNFVVEVPADLGEALQSQNWVFNATVKSSTNQFVSGNVTAPVHRGAFYSGLSPQSYVVPVNTESKVDVVTVTPQGDPVPTTKLDVIISEFQWNSVYERDVVGAYHWETSVLRSPVVTTTLTTDAKGTATLSWTPKKAGQYQIITRGKDQAGNPISSATYVWSSARSESDFVAWPRENNDRIELVADKKLYAPGETAKILVPSPFTGPVKALVTLERAGVLESKVMTLTSNSETIDIPITAEHIPNIFVSVVIVKGVDASNPTAAIRVGLVQLPVDTSQKALSIGIVPSAVQVKPSDTVTYTLTITDSTGKPVPNAETSVALVDKAVLSLVMGDTRNLLDIFYYQRPPGVTTGALLIINRDRLSQQLSEGAKGGGGGGGDGGPEIREDFPDIAFWRADFVTDANGQIKFSVKLPDNLTTWTLLAKAITKETLVGDAQKEIIASKALQVRPLLPRFFTAGDKAQIGAAVLNTTNQAIDELRFTLAVAGATVGTDKTTMTTTLAAGAQTNFNFPITVDENSDSVVLTMTAQSTANDAALADAVRITLPVDRYESPETVATSGAVPAEGQLEAIRVPEKATDNGEFALTLEPSLAAGMLPGLDYLKHYPYECNEQLVSRFLPNLFTVRALRTLKVSNPALESDLATEVNLAVQRLSSRQNSDGGWGYWSGEASTPFITSYVLWGLANAAQMQFAVPERMLTDAVSYLDGQFQAPKDIADNGGENWRLNEMAFTLFVLSEMQKDDPGRTSTLYDARERLSLYGQAYLAMTLANIAQHNNTTDERVDSLLDNLFSSAQLSATGASWHESSMDWQNLNTDTRSTSIILAAFARLDAKQPLLPNVVRWLMSARQAGRWQTTQENAWAIIALTDWMQATGELKGTYAWSVTLNDKDFGSGTAGPENLATPVHLRAALADLLRDQTNALRITRNNASGQLYYTAHLSYYLDALAIEARDSGIVVDRRFELSGTNVTSAQVGDVISVTVTIVAPNDLYHALVEVPIPAGTEPLDPSLATTSVEVNGPQVQPTGDSQNANQQNAWRYWTPTHTDMRDDKVALFATYLPAGTYEYTFQVRASMPGDYRVLPVHAELMYFNEVWGRSAGAQFTVK
ncbi:MAG: Ig-like domain-containing protein [Chloroflexi bacterium]|nr:Ig-like domain-containing protein [Chloroflexota bacterium]